MRKNIKISWVGGQGNYMDYFVKELQKLRNEVMVNDCDEDCDVILCENRNQWQMAREFRTKYPHIPLICWNWDWYDYLKKDGQFISNTMFGPAENYVEFNKLIKESLELWSSTKEWADKCEQDLGIKTAFYFYCLILPWEWEGEKKDWGYILQASRKDPNKRFEWYKMAAEELDIPYKAYHPADNSRKDFINTMKNCRFNVLASREEGIGVTPIEAAYCKKPNLVADTPSARDIWGNDVIYFKRDDYEDFKKQMKWLWDNYDSDEVKEKVERAYKRVVDMYLVEPWTLRINNRLKEIL